MDIIDHPVFGKLTAEERLTITFEGQELIVREGQSVASALMANGVFQFGQSRKLLQPRGLFCANGRCCSCFMTVDGQEHVRVCVTQVSEGLQIRRNVGDPNVRGELLES